MHRNQAWQHSKAAASIASDSFEADLRSNQNSELKLLCEAGFDMDAPDHESTLLGKAVLKQRVAMVRDLLAWKADPNLIFKGDETPLSAAICLENPPIVSLLLDHKAQVGSREIELGQSIDSANQCTILKLLFHAKKHQEEKKSAPPMTQVEKVERHHQRIREMESKLSHDIHALLAPYFSSLSEAKGYFSLRQKKLPDIVLSYLDISKMPLYFSNISLRILNRVSANISCEQFDCLMRARFHINPIYPNKRTMLHWVASGLNSSNKLLPILLAADADVLFKMKNDLTLLHLNVLAYLGSAKNISTLENGVETAGLCNLEEMLLRVSQLTQAADKSDLRDVYCNFDGIKMLIKAGVDVNALTRDGYSVLDFAVIAGRLDMVKMLLEHGADPKRNVTLTYAVQKIVKLKAARKTGRLDVSVYAQMTKEILDYKAIMNLIIKFPGKKTDVALASHSIFPAAQPPSTAALSTTVLREMKYA